jgi:hypothetical protein
VSRRFVALVVTVALAAVAAMGVPTSRAEADEGPGKVAAARPVAPVLAYYYIWYNRDSWARPKTDLPQLGSYSSDEADVMRQHVRMAKSAGITGFIVSWKNTDVLSRRLRQLIDIARSEEFKLSIIYEGLDFHRDPLPIDRVEADLREFATRYAPDPVFRVFDKPMVIWSGTWKVSREDVLRVAGPLRDSLRLLASERSADEYRRLADVVGGNAYYWSSVDPERDLKHPDKLDALASAVHEGGGLWVAPFAPGFDARLVGGSRVVERRDGAQLRDQYRVALDSSPDALGLISWNEFSENTQVEPSRNFGDQYLRVLRDITGTPQPSAGDLAVDSSASSGPGLDSTAWWILGGTAVLALAGCVVVSRRLRRDEGVPFLATRGRSTGRLGAVFATARSRTGTVTLVFIGVVALVASLSALPRPSPVPPVAALPNQLGAKPVADPNEVVVVAAGDVACAADASGRGQEEARQPNSCQEQATADLLTAMEPDAVLALGDLQYPNGSLRRFQEGYDTTWGRFKDRTYPTPGNHEYSTQAASGYFDYFGTAAGSALAGYYSYDLGTWHVVVLNSECDHIGGCELGSPQEQWLRLDLAAHPTRCTLVYWHQPRFSSGKHGSKVTYNAFWQAAYDAGADVVLSAHDHEYERLAPMNPSGEIDPDRGIRSFVVGTGGSTHYRFHDVVPGSEVRLENVFGVLQLTLRPEDYAWRFVGLPGSGASDAGSGTCH